MEKAIIGSIFFPSTFPPVTNIHELRSSRARGRLFFNSSLPLLLVSETSKHYFGDYYRELTLQIAGDLTGTGSLSFLSASRETLSYAPKTVQL